MMSLHVVAGPAMSLLCPITILETEVFSLPVLCIALSHISVFILDTTTVLISVRVGVSDHKPSLIFNSFTPRTPSVGQRMSCGAPAWCIKQ